MDKKAIRRVIMGKRRRIGFNQRNEAFETILNNLKEVFPKVAAGKGPKPVVGSYAPINHELDGLTLLHKLKEAFPNIQFALPCILPDPSADQPSQMEFREYSDYSSLALPQGLPYTFLEPKKTQPVVQPDILLVPCVGFSKGLFRLGMGGGFYDRYLQRDLPLSSELPSPSLAALGASLAQSRSPRATLFSPSSAKSFSSVGGAEEGRALLRAESLLPLSGLLPGSKHPTPPSALATVCVAFEEQKIDGDEWVQPWDTKMDFVVTQKGIYS